MKALTATVQKRVLLVEPNRVVRTLLNLCMQQQGHLVIARESYQDALSLLESEFLKCVPPHVIVVAVQSSQRESLRLLSLLLHQPSYIDTIVVAMVNHDDQQQRDMVLLLRSLRAHVIIKPVEVQGVLSAL